MIGCKDFVPKVRQKAFLFQAEDMETLSETFERLNQWIATNEIDVINVETVVLPNMHDHDEDGSSDVNLRTSGDMMSEWYQFFRVWFRR